MTDFQNIIAGFCMFQINVRNDGLTEQQYQVTAVPQTFMEVSCPIEKSKKRSMDVEAEIDNIVARAYNISLSNDGVNFSEEDTLLVYDSACVICTKIAGAITCHKQVGCYLLKFYKSLKGFLTLALCHVLPVN